MIALTDTQIGSWTDKIDNDKKYKLFIRPKYIPTSSYPAILASLIESSHSITYLRNDIYKDRDLTFTHEEIFSISIEKNDRFLEILESLRNESIGNKFVDEQGNTKDINIKNLTPVRENISQHIFNNKDYVRYIFTMENASIYHIVVQFWLIENALKIATTDTKFNVGDIVSPKSDKSEDYLIIESVVATDDFKVVQIKSITDDIITYGKKSIMRSIDMAWSRTNRIDAIINQ